jgi:hypothetical protein
MVALKAPEAVPGALCRAGRAAGTRGKLMERQAMRRFLLVVLGVAFLMSGAAHAADKCAGCNWAIGGYLAPNFRVIDNSGSKDEAYSSNMGFGMAFNRFGFTGEMESGKIVKKTAWNVEVDVSDPSGLNLQWAYVQPKFSDAISVKFGHLKKAFSREALHSTNKLLTADRTFSFTELKALGYVNFNYGIELHVTQPMYTLQAGTYAGSPENSKVSNQDPGLDYGARAIITPVPDLQIGVNAMVLTLFEDGNNQALYPDDVKSNRGMAFGFDADYKKDWGKMGLWAQAEVGMGDNWDPDMGGGPKPAAKPYEDLDWYKFQYFYGKALFLLTPEFGVHLAYTSWDPNTDGTVGKKDAITTLTPGVTYYWAKNMRTQAELQLWTEGQGEGNADLKYTDIVVQQVFTW